MKLRYLQEKDSLLIMEWIKDPDLNCFFRFNPDNITHETVRDFITQSREDKQNKHYAIVDKKDEYLGTISLKNIDYENKNAEYAIALRKYAIGKGVALFATNSILNIAFYTMGLNKVYLNVLSENFRAIRFYEKSGFQYEGEFKKHIKINNEYKDLKWYCMLETSFYEK